MRKYPIYFFRNRESGEIVYIGCDKYKLIGDRYESRLHCTCNSYDEMRSVVNRLCFLYKPKVNETFI